MAKTPKKKFTARRQPAPRPPAAAEQSATGRRAGASQGKRRGGPPRRPGGPQQVRSARGRSPASPATPSPEKGDFPPGERLQKVLAAAGIASRRVCEQLIQEGRVEVDGQTVAEIGSRVDPARQQIRVDGEALPKTRLVYFAVHKPPGVVSTSRDPAGRPRVIDLLPPGTPRVFCVGRLDLASEGLILVTNDGELAQGLTHPRHGVEKIYSVQVAGLPEPDVLAQMRRGVHLAEGFARAVQVRVKSRHKNSTLLEMTLDEGRNREIRRLLARLGHKVQRLVRAAVGPVRLGDLPRGGHRRLTAEEVQQLRQAVAGLLPKTRGGDASDDAPRRPSGRPRPRSGQRPAPRGKGRRRPAATTASGKSRHAQGGPPRTGGAPGGVARRVILSEPSAEGATEATPAARPPRDRKKNRSRPGGGTAQAPRRPSKRPPSQRPRGKGKRPS